MSMTTHGIDRHGLRSRLIGVVAAMVTVSVIAVSVAAIAAFDRAVEPELLNRTRLIGSIVRADIQRALDIGIPFYAIVGLEQYISETLERFDEVDRISVNTESGRIVAAVERPERSLSIQQIVLGNAISMSQMTTELPVLDGNKLVGQITIDVNPIFVETRLREVFLDVAVITLVAMLVALELALMVAITSVGKPLDRLFCLLAEQRTGVFLHCIRPGGISGIARAAFRLNDHAQDLAERWKALRVDTRARLVDSIAVKIAHDRPVRLRLSDIHDIRLALFLFSTAAEIAAAFLPVYARTLARPEWLSPELAAATPLIAYLAAISALLPFGEVLVRRFGARRLFLVAVPPTVLALVAMGFVEGIFGIALCRGVMALSYAVATIACQQYAVRAEEAQYRIRAIGAFVGVVFGGVFCGSALGGIVAGRFGIEAAFLTGAAIACMAGVSAFYAMRGTAGDPAVPADYPVDERKDRRVWTLRFIVLMLGVTVPLSATTAIVIWYLTPLTLATAGSGPAEIARVVMLYYLIAVLLGSSVTRLSIRGLGSRLLVAFGAFLSGVSLFSVVVGSGFWAVVMMISGLGVSHTLIRAPLYSIALEGNEAGGPGLGAVRMFERAGAIVGLVVSAVFLMDIGVAQTISVLGTAVLLGFALYTLVEVIHHFQSS